MSKWLEIVSVVFLLGQLVEHGNALTSAEQQELLNIHNALRAGEGSSNMQIMKWSQDLAYMAQNWSNGCNFAHGQGLNSSSLKDLNVGQNLYGTSSKTVNLTAAVIKWFNEKPSYSYGSNTCATGKVCGHYTQVVWSGSNLLGCGYTSCPLMTMLVCNYGPAGNVAGSIPYKLGPACTQCNSGSFLCNNGLCDNDCTSANPACVCKAACKNCGQQTADCRCQCGTGWAGVDCSDVCKDNDSRCGANPGWPYSLCGNSYVFAQCPKLCLTCQDGTPAACP